MPLYQLCISYNFKLVLRYILSGKKDDQEQAFALWLSEA
jgi:hypothetical protein